MTNYKRNKIYPRKTWSDERNSSLQALSTFLPPKQLRSEWEIVNEESGIYREFWPKLGLKCQAFCTKKSQNSALVRKE